MLKMIYLMKVILCVSVAVRNENFFVPFLLRLDRLVVLVVVVVEIEVDN